MIETTGTFRSNRSSSTILCAANAHEKAARRRLFVERRIAA